MKGTRRGLAGFGGSKEKGKMMELYFNWENIGEEKVTGESKVFVPFESLGPLLRVRSVMSDTSEGLPTWLWAHRGPSNSFFEGGNTALWKNMNF